MILKRSLKLCVDWSQVDKTQYMEAMVKSVMDSTSIKNLILPAVTDRIDDREMFMKASTTHITTNKNNRTIWHTKINIESWSSI